MLVGLYHANPQAFAGKNMNRLKAGQILNVPDAETVRSTAGGNTNAHSVVVAHAADFNAYRNHLADFVDHAPAAKQVAEKQSAGGAITAKVKEVPTATSESADKLKLSKATPSPSQKGGNGKGASEEDKLARQKASEEAAGRLKELEKNVGDLQRLLDVKNKDLAAKEAELNAKAVKDKQVAASSVAAAPGKAVAVPASTAANVTSTAPASTAAVATPASAPVEKQAASAADASASATAAAPVKPKRRAVAPPPPPPEPSFFDSMSDWLVPGGGVLLALLAGAGVWMNRRKKKLQQFEDSILTGSSMKANSMFGSTGGQSVDTNNSVFNSNFAPSASQLDANEVDPVAEADVYIAYGRDSQAEEILKEALRTQPDRHAVRLKLLEIYFARKDAKLFERLASELYGMTSGQGEEWAQASSMGIVLEPGNPLYAGGKAKAEMMYGAGLGSPTQPLEDLDPDALLGNSLSRDMLEAISIIDTATHGETKEPEYVEPPVSDEHIVDTHDAGLDFDLGIGDGDVPQIPESAPHNSVMSTSEQIPEVDFGSIDFDFGDSSPVVKSAESSDHHEVHSETESEDLHALDFAEPIVEVQAPELHFETEIPVVAEELKLPLEEGLDEMREPIPEAASAFEFDLSGISLDLPSDAPHATESLVVESVVSEVPVVNAEMSTKLDLAVAYHEIGDKEGARELLDEVLKGGTAEQKERAGTMLAQMA